MLRKTVLAALLTSTLALPLRAAELPLDVVSIDMEGGGGTLFVTPEGKSLLIDTGWPSDFGLLPSPDGARNSADRIVSAARKLGISQIDYLIVTHYHMDHVGGIQDLVAKMPVGTFIDHGPNAEHAAPGEKVDFGAPDALYPKYLETIKGHDHMVVKPGKVISIGSMTVTIVASDGETIQKPLPGAGAKNPACDTPQALSTRAEGGVENSRSVASLITFGKVRLAMFGDLSWQKEHDLSCPIGRLGHVNILIATQHGSNISSNPASIADMKPDIVVMGSGGKKGGDEEPIKTLKASPGLMGFWQTHESYAHPEWTGDKDMVANLNPPADAVAGMAGQLYTAPPDKGYAIHLAILRGGTVTVTNDRNDFSKTYTVK